MTFSAIAQEQDHSAEHGGQFYHRFQLEVGSGMAVNDQHLYSGELDGWIGTDENRLRIDSNIFRAGADTEQAGIKLLYSRNLSTFWDVQVGLRQDTRPETTTYLTFGVEGLAPYFFATDMHLFVSEQGDVSLQLRQENDLLLTQRLILQPFLQASLMLQDVPELNAGAGLSEAEIGLQFRYEFTRKFAPYARIGYEHRFGDTAAMAIAKGHDRNTISAMFGLRLLF